MLNPKDVSFTLYHYWRSSSSWRVRIALDYKKISYQSVDVNLLNGESESAAHLARNPSGFVPTLAVTHSEKAQPQYLNESLAIIRFLDEWKPEPSLTRLKFNPAAGSISQTETLIQEAKIWELAEIINSGTQPIQNIPVFTKHSNDPAEQKLWIQYWIRNGLQNYENALPLNSSSTPYSHGNILTVADVCLVPQCYNAIRYDVDLIEFPSINRIYQHLITLPCIQSSHPDQHKPT